jgi:hypothetical protein
MNYRSETKWMTVNEDCASAIPNSLRRKLFWRMSMIRGLFLVAVVSLRNLHLDAFSNGGRPGFSHSPQNHLLF